LLVFAISPYKQHVTWLLIYLIGFFVLHWLEFYYPHLVQHPFLAGKGQFIDRVTAFPIPVIAIFIVIKFIKKSYDKEKKVTEEKTIVVEKSNEQILLQKNQLEESNSEKNKLMSIISHDLRSPLTNIQNYLVLLNQVEIDNSERRTIEQALLKSTDNAMQMLSNLLHWSKSQMEGPISVEAKILDNECKITISDNGQGISAINQKDIFSIKAKPAYGTANEKGVGLGLVLCKEFIDRQGGRIGFESKLGEGSSFFVFLPIKQLSSTMQKN
ncbi:MAG: sensor histidine kinase, partial [Pedobacter sp.]